jgi:IclR family transcriptional regulator, KDG regulon repressor
MKNSGRSQTVDHALNVLEHLARAGGPKSLTVLSDELGYSKATTYRMVATLRDRGYVAQDPTTQQYSFGAACSQLVDHAWGSLSVTSAVLPAMRKLAEATKETVYLAVLRSGQAVVAEKFDSQLPVVATSSLGRVLPLYAVSGGLVILAGQPDDEVAKHLSGKLEAFTKKTVTDPDRILATVRRVRRQGYAVNRENFREGVCGIAMPIRRSGRGAIFAAFGVCVPRQRFNPEVLIRPLSAATNMASEALSSFYRQPETQVATARRPARPATTA